MIVFRSFDRSRGTNEKQRESEYPAPPYLPTARRALRAAAAQAPECKQNAAGDAICHATGEYMRLA